MTEILDSALSVFPAVILIASLASIRSTKQSDMLGEECVYSNWTSTLLLPVSFLSGSCFAFAGSFLFFPRLNFLDAAKLNRRILRDACRVAKHCIALQIVQLHRPWKGEVRDADELDEAEAHHVQLLEHLLWHLDQDITHLRSVHANSALECRGCCCIGQRGSVLTPSLSARTKSVAHHAYALLRFTLTDFHDVDNFEGRQLANFAMYSGHVRLHNPVARVACSADRQNCAKQSLNTC